MSNTELRRIAIIGGSRIPFCRSNTFYAEQTNLDMLSSALQGLVKKFALQGQQIDEVIKKVGEGSIEELLHAGDTWSVDQEG